MIVSMVVLSNNYERGTHRVGGISWAAGFVDSDCVDELGGVEFGTARDCVARGLRRCDPLIQ